MSEDEEYLVEEVIKVVITSKADTRLNVDFDVKKKKLPKIFVTDCSLHLEEDSSNEVKDESLLDARNEFECEPTELMPESFMTFLSSCKGLISDISSYKEERVAADDWIEIFDKKIEEDLKKIQDIEEEKKQQILLQEERRRRIEARKKIRKIFKPLINSIPTDPILTSRSAHDRVCFLPLEKLKSKLAKYKENPPTILFQKDDSQFDQELDKVEILTTSEAVFLLKSTFDSYLNEEVFKSLMSVSLNIEGEQMFEEKYEKKMTKSAEDKREKEIIVELPLETVLNVTPKKTSVKLENMMLKWKFDKKEGTIQPKPIRNYKGHHTVKTKEKAETLASRVWKRIKRSKSSKEIIHVHIRGLDKEPDDEQNLLKTKHKMRLVEKNKKFNQLKKLHHRNICDFRFTLLLHYRKKKNQSKKKLRMVLKMLKNRRKKIKMTKQRTRKRSLRRLK